MVAMKRVNEIRFWYEGVGEFCEKDIVSEWSRSVRPEGCGSSVRLYFYSRKVYLVWEFNGWNYFMKKQSFTEMK